ncbi:MAG: flagellar motor protein MotB [Desulfocapsaceae bacterium]|nr:flagellar motor protein MotB [Desulfocapsaceae bacterium]
MTENVPSEGSEQTVVPEQEKQPPPNPVNLSTKGISPPTSPLDNKFRDMDFLVDDTFYRSRTPKAVHWSIAWSDLMMTMFILFLTMFVYQSAHEDFLVKKKPEIVGGSTTDAIDINNTDNNASLPFPPIQQGLPFITAGTIKKVETVTGEAMSPEEEKRLSRSDILEKAAKREPHTTIDIHDNQVLTSESKPVLPQDKPSPPGPDTAKTQIPAVPLDAIYDLSQQALDKNNLKKFASIDLIPDNTMRIILTGDLLFNTGKADLSKAAKESLQKIATAIKQTPFMINVIGHTDNLPMHSERFNTNWELSVARASRVARFLIEETNMNPNQFVVSGYSSFRPVKPNTNAENRASNRRVEIIISKKLPPAAQASSEDLEAVKK